MGCINELHFFIHLLSVDSYSGLYFERFVRIHKLNICCIASGEEIVCIWCLNVVKIMQLKNISVVSSPDRRTMKTESTSLDREPEETPSSSSVKER